MAISDERVQALQARGVVLHAPAATVIGDEVEADAFEEGVELFPGVVIRGVHSRFGRGTKLGQAGGGYFEDVATGRQVQLYGGFFQDCALLDGVVIRGQAELRGGTLLEEGCEGAHHVGYKMTIMLPWAVAGSLVNFCDALLSGGTSRKNHSEIGSTLALYNFTPWGDKWASLFGDVPRGVLLRQRPIFIGGQTQIVSPVEVGFGAVLAAGSPVRRHVPENTLYSEAAPGALALPFVPEELGAVLPRLKTTLRYLANLAALHAWYRHFRLPAAEGDAHLQAVYRHALRQIEANVEERIRRLKAVLERVPESLERHRAQLGAKRDGLSYEQRFRRVEDHEAALKRWPTCLQALEALPRQWPELDVAERALFERAVGELRASSAETSEPQGLVSWVAGALSDEQAAELSSALQRLLERTLSFLGA